MKSSFTSRLWAAHQAAIAMLAIALLCALNAQPAHAQAVWARGGVSTLMNASGFELNYKWSPVQGWFGLGFSDGALFGGYVESKYRGMNVGVGDRYQELRIGSDMFDEGRYFTGRGISVRKSGEAESLSVFVGQTSEEHSSSFFRTFKGVENTFGIFYNKKIANKLEYSGYNLAQHNFTSIHSLRYNFNERLSIGLAGGLGGSSPYAAISSQLSGRKYNLVASYAGVGDKFQRIGGIVNNAPEREGANVRFRYVPFRRLSFSAAHENFFSPVLKDGDKPLRVSLDSLSTSTSLAGFGLGGSVSRSTAGALRADTEQFTVSRSIMRSVNASGSIMRMTSEGQTTNIYTANLQENISPRLQIHQGLNHQSSQNNLTWGARFLSNRFTVGLDHDVAYTPLAGGFGGKNFTQFWNVSLNIRVYNSVRLHTESMIDPAGRMRYTAWFDGIGFARNGEQIPTAMPNTSLGKFVVKGIVQDVEGKPVWGISVQVDGQSVYSDNAGRFFIRFRRGERQPVAVVPDRSLNPQYYVVVQAPVTALPETEDIAQDIIIVVRRANAPKPTTAPKPRRRSELDEPASDKPADTNAHAGSPEQDQHRDGVAMVLPTPAGAQ